MTPWEIAWDQARTLKQHSSDKRFQCCSRPVGWLSPEHTHTVSFYIQTEGRGVLAQITFMGTQFSLKTPRGGSWPWTVQSSDL